MLMCNFQCIPNSLTIFLKIYIVQAAFVADNCGVTANTYVDVVQCIMPLRIKSETDFDLSYCVRGPVSIWTPIIVSSQKKQLTTYELFDMMQRLYGTVSYYVI